MPKFRKKPIVLNATQYSQKKHLEDGTIPEGCSRRHVTDENGAVHEQSPIIRTLEGDMEVSDGDWVVGPGVEGEYWPVKDSIFKETYERIFDGAQAS